jgi:hypothetical protein
MRTSACLLFENYKGSCIYLRSREKGIIYKTVLFWSKLGKKGLLVRCPEFSYQPARRKLQYAQFLIPQPGGSYPEMIHI